MKYYNIKIEFTLKESDYKQYNKNIDNAIALILPYEANCKILENDYIKGD